MTEVRRRTWTQLSEDEKTLVRHRYLTGAYSSLKECADSEQITIGTLREVSATERWSVARRSVHQDEIRGYRYRTAARVMEQGERLLRMFNQLADLAEAKMAQALEYQHTPTAQEALELMKSATQAWKDLRSAIGESANPDAAVFQDDQGGETTQVTALPNETVQPVTQLLGDVMSLIFDEYSKEQAAKKAGVVDAEIVAPPAPPQTPHDQA